MSAFKRNHGECTFLVGFTAEVLLLCFELSPVAGRMSSQNETLGPDQRRSLTAVVWDGILIVNLVLFALAFVVVPVVILWRDQGGFIAAAIVAVIALAVWAQTSPLLKILKGLNESVAWRSIAYGVIALWVLALLRVALAVCAGYRGAVPFL